MIDAPVSNLPQNNSADEDAADREARAASRRSFKRLAFFASVVFVFTAAFLLLKVAQRRSELVGDGNDPKTYGFDLSNLNTAGGKLVGAHMPRDAMRVLDDPQRLSEQQVRDGWLKTPGPKYVDTVALDVVNIGPGNAFTRLILDSDEVIGVTVGLRSRAYPLRFMRWHEIVNDQIGNTPIAVTYNGLCDSAVVFDRRAGGKELRFGYSGLLLNSNLVMYDRQPAPPEGTPKPAKSGESLWSQLRFEAIAGPMAVTKLSVLPITVTTWSEWRKAHPETTMLVGEYMMRSEYGRDVFADRRYYETGKTWFPVEPMPDSDSPLAVMDALTAVNLDDRWNVFPIVDSPTLAIRREFMRSNLYDTGTAQFLSRFFGMRRQPSIHARWFAWHAFHGDAGLHLDAK